MENATTFDIVKIFVHILYNRMTLGVVSAPRPPKMRIEFVILKLH